MPGRRKIMTPENGGYMMAAYIVAAVIYLTYALSLWVRGRRAMNDKR